MNTRTKMLTSTAMLCAIAYIAVAACRIPVVLFLKYDPKDVIITLGGLIWGPMTSCFVSVIVSLIEMLTISETGILGCLMNILSTCSFACTTSLIYKKKHTLAGAVTGFCIALESCAHIAGAVMVGSDFLRYKSILIDNIPSGVIVFNIRAAGKITRRCRIL